MRVAPRQLGQGGLSSDGVPPPQGEPARMQPVRLGTKPPNFHLPGVIQLPRSSHPLGEDVQVALQSLRDLDLVWWHLALACAGPSVAAGWDLRRFQDGTWRGFSLAMPPPPPKGHTRLGKPPSIPIPAEYPDAPRCPGCPHQAATKALKERLMWGATFSPPPNPAPHHAWSLHLAAASVQCC